MLRHECAEALGAIGEGDAVLERLSRDASEPFEVRQTCEIARDFLKWRRAGSEGEAPIACACMLSPFNSHDPAPPDPAHVNWSCDQLEDKLRDANADMFERYRCIVLAARNRGGEDSCAGPGADPIRWIKQSSALVAPRGRGRLSGRCNTPASLECPGGLRCDERRARHCEARGRRRAAGRARRALGTRARNYC